MKKTTIWFIIGAVLFIAAAFALGVYVGMTEDYPPHRTPSFPDDLFDKLSIPVWNVEDVNSNTNGNCVTALFYLIENDDTKTSAETADPALVIKSPWDYYGKIIAVSGYVILIDDYPPGS
ncbi:MAG: hypothetical protein LBT88_08190, partial [Oscillospiraceae bacterium]|nr:hypothetical protein [Oscillospiraceae bacterium]